MNGDGDRDADDEEDDDKIIQRGRNHSNVMVTRSLNNNDSDEFFN